MLNVNLCTSVHTENTRLNDREMQKLSIRRQQKHRMVGCGLWGVNWVGRNDSNICSNHSALSLAEQFKRKSCMVVPLTSFCLNYHSRSQSKGFQPNQRPSSCYKYLKQVQDNIVLLEHMLCNTLQEQTPFSLASVPPHDYYKWEFQFSSSDLDAPNKMHFQFNSKFPVYLTTI